MAVTEPDAPAAPEEADDASDGEWEDDDPSDPLSEELENEGYTVEKEDREHMPGDQAQTRATPVATTRRVVGSQMMVIVDTSGIHELPVAPCLCATAKPIDIQLLELGLYPATQRRPKTAFTTRCLDDVPLDQQGVSNGRNELL